MPWRSVIYSVIDYLLGKKKWESPEAILAWAHFHRTVRYGLVCEEKLKFNGQIYVAI